MTKEQWSAAIEFLENGESGGCIMYNNREIVITDIISRKYIAYDNGEYCGHTNIEWRAVGFLKTGQIKYLK